MKNKLLNINDNPREASNVFNNYFTDVGKNLAKKGNKTSNLILNKRDNNILCSFDNIVQEKIDVLEIRQIILNFKDDTAAEYNKVSAKRYFIS